MKTLKDILVEKLKVDDIILDKKFPIDGEIGDIVKFLKEQGFKKASSHGYISNGANSIKSKSFTIEIFVNNYKIWFADTSKENVSKNNPIFYIYFANEKEYNVFYPKNSSRGLWCIDIVKNDKRAFMKELNKCFDWE